MPVEYPTGPIPKGKIMYTATIIGHEVKRFPPDTRVIRRRAKDKDLKTVVNKAANASILITGE